MARCYHIACARCKTYLWVGQSMVGRPPETALRIYARSDYIDRFKDFLEKHREHPLHFMESQQTPYDYEDAEPEEAEPPATP